MSFPFCWESVTTRRCAFFRTVSPFLFFYLLMRRSLKNTFLQPVSDFTLCSSNSLQTVSVCGNWMWNHQLLTAPGPCPRLNVFDKYCFLPQTWSIDIPSGRCRNWGLERLNELMLPHLLKKQWFKLRSDKNCNSCTLTSHSPFQWQEKSL